MFGNAEAVAKLKSLPYQIAIAYAKIVDPASVAREGEVAAAQKYLIPSGWTMTGKVSNDVTLAAIKSQRSDLGNRIKTWQENTGGETPANLPASLTGKPAGAPGVAAAFKNPEDVRAAYQAGKLSAADAAQILAQQFGMQSGAGAPRTGTE
jgi:hypothetical protein